MSNWNYELKSRCERFSSLTGNSNLDELNNSNRNLK